MTKVLIDEATVKLVLGALKQIDDAMPFPVAKLAQAALRKALAEQPAQQEPVAWISHNAGLYHFKPDQSLDPLPLYLAPPAQRKPLTDDEIWREYRFLWPFHPAEERKLASDILMFARAIEAAHGIKENT